MCPTRPTTAARLVNPAQTNTDGNNAFNNKGGQDNLGDACDDNISGDGYTEMRGHTASWV